MYINELMSGHYDANATAFLIIEDGYKGMLVVRSELTSVCLNAPVKGALLIHWNTCGRETYWFINTQELSNGVLDVEHYKKNLIMILHVKL